MNEIFDDDVLSPETAIEAMAENAEKLRAAGIMAFAWPAKPDQLDAVRIIAHQLLAIEPELDFEKKSRAAVAIIATVFGERPASEAAGMLKDVEAYPNARRGVQAFLAALAIVVGVEQIAWAAAAPSN